MGAMELIPGDIDLLIAGCSCVDFSTLNSAKEKDYSTVIAKKGHELFQRFNKNRQMNDIDHENVAELFELSLQYLDEMGSSAQTFFSMLSYVRDYQPRIVILENVQQAPWDDMTRAWFPCVGYAAAHVKLDTKDYYLPQTRSRGYLVAVSKAAFGDELAEEVVRLWSRILSQDLTRRASTPLNSWLLPPAHPLTERARHDDSERAVTNPSNPHEWERSKSRHLRVRKQEGLGEGRPMTQWAPTDTGRPYDRIDRLVLLTQGSRVQDCIEIWQMRGLITGMKIGDTRYTFDLKFKNRVIDLSQNIDRSIFTVPFGVTGCLTPGGIPWITDQCRLVSGYETLILQGLPVNRLQFATETQDQLRDLAGNAMSTTVAGAAIVAILSAIKEGSNLELTEFFPKSTGVKKAQKTDRCWIVLKSYSGFNTMASDTISVSDMVKLFKRCRRYCFCNGSAKYSTDDFMQCEICSTIRCRWCCGNPEHSFKPAQRPSDYLSLTEVNQAVMQFLPSITTDMVRLDFTIPDGPMNMTTIACFPEIMKKLLDTVFYYQTVHVTEAVTVCYIGQEGFELRAKLSEEGITWYLYLDGWSQLATKLIEMLGMEPAQLVKQPIAKAQVDKDSLSILPQADSWELWDFDPKYIDMKVESSTGCINVDIENGFSNDLAHLKSVCGKYEYKPQCDAPEDSLHVLETKEGKLFLFKDTARVDPVHEDGYVISRECRPLEPHEYREVCVRFTAGKDLRNNRYQRDMAKVDGGWTRVYLPKKSGFDNNTRSIIEAREMLRVSYSVDYAIWDHYPNQHVLAEGRMVRHEKCDPYGVFGYYKRASNAFYDERWITVTKSELHHFHNFVAPFNVKLSLVKDLEVRTRIADMNLEPWLEKLRDWRSDLDGQVKECKYGQLPAGRFIRVDNRYVLHYLSDAMAAFEAYQKTRVPVFEVRVKVRKIHKEHTGTELMYETSFRYLINYSALGHQAAAYLPPSDDPTAHMAVFAQVERNAVISENLQINSDSGRQNRHTFEPFRMSLMPLRGPLIMKQRLDESFSTKLSESQSRSVDHMLERELGSPEFIEQEIEEELETNLRFRLIGRAERQVCNHGGVLAHDVGYGKTIVTLALIHLQQEFDKTESIEKRATKNPGLNHLKATLVVVPCHLVDQWASEAKKFMNIESSEIVQIKHLRDLVEESDWRVHKRLENAKLIILNTDVLNSSYYANVAKLAGSLEPPYADGAAVKGRAFQTWLEESVSEAGKNANKLIALHQDSSLDPEALRELRDDIESRRTRLYRTYRRFVEDYKLRKPTVKKVSPKTAGPRVEYERAVEVDLDRQQIAWSSLMEELSPRPSEKSIQEGFVHIFEAYTYARVIYDEFSYDNFAADNFVRHSQAYSKWVLSATPPTRNLKAVCGIADLINIHVARAVHSRAGMPRVTEGPELQDKSNAESLMARKFLSDESTRERHEIGKKFLSHFAKANPLDKEYAGGVKVEEKVVLSEMTRYEYILYLDLQQDLKMCDFNADRLSAESRSFLLSLIGQEAWNATQDGKHVSTKALVYRCSISPEIRCLESSLLEERKRCRRRAIEAFHHILKKGIWLAKRVLNNNDESRVVNGASAADDICNLIRDISSKEYARWGGADTWKMVLGGALNGMLEEHGKADERDGRILINAVSEGSYFMWHQFYDLTSEDLQTMEEDEAEHLVENLKRTGPIEKFQRATNLETLEALVDAKFDFKAFGAEIKESPAQNDTPQNEDAKRHAKTKAAWSEKFRSVGLHLESNTSTEALASLWEKHLKGKLDDTFYVGHLQNGNRRYPRLGGTVKIRGGNYTFTGSDLSDTTLELRKAQELAISAIKQARIVENLMLPEKILRCNSCGKQRQIEELHMVSECGHVICQDHRDLEFCGDKTNECRSPLKNATISLMKTKQLPETPEFAHRNNFSSKTLSIVKLIQGFAKDEYAIVFSAWTQQIGEICRALDKHGISFTRSAKSNQDRDCKVRVLQLNHASSAGTNLQYANHVIFASPLLVDLQENYDAYMKQAKGRCIRYGQERTVHVYHCVAANTIEVDILELRSRCHVLARHGESVGRLQPATPEELNMVSKENSSHAGTSTGPSPGTSSPPNSSEDLGDICNATPAATPAADDSTSIAPGATSDTTKEFRVKSILNPQDIWKALNEQNYLTMHGIEY